MRDRLSVVISAFNEESNIVPLHRRLKEAVSSLPLASVEYLFVDDGSTDGTLERCRQVQRDDPNVKIVRLLRNFGHEAAMTAGMEHASGDGVVFMDADFQHPPELVGEMVRRWREGNDIILTRRTANADASALYRFSARLFHRILRVLSDTNIPADTPDFRLLDRKYVDILKRFNERDSLFRGLLAWGVDMDRMPVMEFAAPGRRSGESKYNSLTSLKLGVNSIIQFSVKPLYLSLILAGLTALFAAGLGANVFIERYVLENPTPGYATIVLTTLIMGSINLVVLAIIGAYVAKIHLETKKRPIYLAEFIPPAAGPADIPETPVPPEAPGNREGPPCPG
ncbi:MAG: glycosyltransferase family 2 protein [Planctomycetota bacterium]|jgi:dolichol-phosphate mannosyltransferase|nr:glycosyltransferase family 2 protein [Planctomycetota bacterium]